MTAQEVLESALQSNLMGLTLKQPYAELMSYGKVETRTWRTNKRGWVLITSSKKAYNDEQIVQISGGHNALFISNIGRIGYNRNGHALSLGKLVDCRRPRPSDPTFTRLDEYELATKWCWIFEDLIEIEPFPVKGKLNLWDANSLKSQIQLKR